MTNHRDGILSAVRTALGRSSARSLNEARIAGEAAALLAEPDKVRPMLASSNLIDAFIARATSAKVGATAERLGALSELPGAVRRYLDGNGLRSSIALQPAASLLALDWSGIETHPRAAPDETVSVGLARWGIAETGSLVFHSGPDTPILSNFLALHHLVALRAATIVPYLEDYTAASAAMGPSPRNVNLITGASGTTDIEGSYVRGAHGPRYLHILLVEEGH